MEPAGTEKTEPKRHRAGYIKDARGRRITQIDPVATYLLRQYDIIDKDALRAIANEDGVGIQHRERISLIIGAAGALLVAGLLIQSVIAGDFAGAPFARTSALLWFCLVAWMIWLRSKRARFGNIKSAMLKHLRCPHCGYDLRLLPTDPQDGATICPECGCSWILRNRE